MVALEDRGSKFLGATLRVELKATPRTIRAVATALNPETSAGNKCKMKLSQSPNGDTLSLAFESSDLASLRASLNTNLRLLSASLKAIDAVSNFVEPLPENIDLHHR